MSLFKPEILTEFEGIQESLAAVLPEIRRELHQCLLTAGIALHGFTARVKQPESLLQKISRPDRTYSRIWDITDLIGIRVITAFEDSIEDVARVIESHYEVDLAHSRNRLQFQDHERFGYRSLHYVCRLPKGLDLPPTWLELARFEIQVRSALQDVWAEIEHDLGYKASELASTKLRRRFSRISSLLEIADEELVAIKTELRQYIDERRDHSLLDLVSFKDLLEHSGVVETDLEIARTLQLKTSEEPFFPDYLLRVLHLAGFTTEQEVLTALNRERSEITSFVPLYFEFAGPALGLPVSSLKSVPRAYSLLFLAHVHLIEQEPLAVNRVRRFADFYTRLDYPDDEAKAWEVARQLVKTLERN